MSPEDLVPNLVKQAAKAIPSCPKGKPGPVSKWPHLYPIYAQLRANKFTIKEAVDWMIRKGVVEEKNRKAAENGLSVVDSRRSREAKNHA
jgi:hypothetical protein